MSDAFDAVCAELFREQFPRVFRILDRTCGDPDTAADLAQEAFVRLYQRGSLPDEPAAWLISVALNLLRNHWSTRSRRQRLLTTARGEASLADPPASPDQRAVAGQQAALVRALLDRMTDRDRGLLLLWAEGYSYRDMARALSLKETSVGTLLSRAQATFRQLHGAPDAS